MLMARFGRKVAEDTLDVFACHGMGGTVGMILTSCFQSTAAGAWDGLDGAFYGRGVELGKCIAVLLALAVWYLVSTYAILALVNVFVTVRVSLEEELEGLDVSKHAEHAYNIPTGEVKVSVE
jgi:Amt family ammonium transporter